MSPGRVDAARPYRTTRKPQLLDALVGVFELRPATR